MISKTLHSKIKKIINYRSSNDENKSLYESAFKDETIFVLIKNEFIPIRLFTKNEQQDINDEFGPAVIDLSFDKDLSEFYKTHDLKRDFHFLSENISYLHIEDQQDENDHAIRTEHIGKRGARLREYFQQLDLSLRGEVVVLHENLLDPRVERVGIGQCGK